MAAQVIVGYRVKDQLLCVCAGAPLPSWAVEGTHPFPLQFIHPSTSYYNSWGDPLPWTLRD